MKKIWLIFLIIFIVIDSILIVSIISHKKYVNEIDNDKIHIDMIDGYYLTSNYKNDTDVFKLYSDNRKSSVSITILEQIPSNQTLYTNEQMLKSINYQVLKNIKNFEQEKFIIDNNNFSYSKNHDDNNIMEVIIRYDTSNILVISYISPKNLYDEELIIKLNENIILK